MKLKIKIINNLS